MQPPLMKPLERLKNTMKKINNWRELDFWNSGEYQVIEEKLNELDASGRIFNPGGNRIFAALDATPLDKARVAIIGQDPYPNEDYATGVAFSIPTQYVEFPVTLSNIFREYSSDLHYPTPTTGDLKPWCKQGVLLWNAIPTCERDKPLSHRDWTEWTYLTKEIIEVLSAQGAVFAFLGNVASEYIKYVDTEESRYIKTSHPSPRGNLNSKSPFLGSRLFSSINSLLVELGKEPVDWRLQ